MTKLNKPINFKSFIFKMKVREYVVLGEKLCLCFHRKQNTMVSSKWIKSGLTGGALLKIMSIKLKKNPVKTTVLVSCYYKPSLHKASIEVWLYSTNKLRKLTDISDIKQKKIIFNWVVHATLSITCVNADMSVSFTFLYAFRKKNIRHQ